MKAFINGFVNLVLVSKDTEQSMEGQEQEVPFPLLENTLTSCMLFLPWFFLKHLISLQYRHSVCDLVLHEHTLKHL